MTDQTPDPGYAGIADLDRLIHEPARLALMSLLYVIESADFTFVMNQTGLDLGQPFHPHEQAGGSRLHRGGKGFQGQAPEHDPSSH